MCPKSEDNIDDYKLQLAHLHRELEIEAALERIRSRTMSMVQSEELGDVIKDVFREAGHLGFGARACDLVIIDPKTKASSFWISGDLDNPDGFSVQMQIKPFNHPHYKNGIRAWQQQKPHRTSVLKDQVCSSYMKGLMAAATSNTMPKPAQAYVKKLKFIIHTEAYMKYGYFRVASLEKLSNSEKDILVRIAKVFEQTYTRFLDLQKAEAQAKEAQVEAALERVRARTMAMHSSEDVGNTVSLMFEQLDKLNISTVRCGLGIFLENYRMEVWTAKASSTENVEKVVGYLDMKIHKLLKVIYHAWQSGQKYKEYDLNGKDLIKYFKALNKAPEYPINFDLASLPARQFHSSYYFKEGVLFAFTEEPLRQETQQVFERFAGVFGQTYRRYLDLQKAEEQAREAQIEAALERVRAASMAMHKTAEISDVVVVLFKQLKELNLEFIASWINVFHLDEGYYDTWISPMEGYNDLPFYVKLPSNLFEETSLKSWKEGNEFTSLSFANKDAVNEAMVGFDAATNTNFFTGIQKVFQLERLEFISATYAYGDVSISTVDPASDEYKGILKRFTRVFEQCYTRFLDLQKAEAQAWEAQIETALERVRNRTLLMKDSSELHDAVGVIFQEFKRLDLLPEGARTYFCDIDQKNLVANVWMTNADGTVKDSNHQTPVNKSPSLSKYYKAWKRQDPILVRKYVGKELKEYLSYVSSLPHVKNDKGYQKIFRNPPKQIYMTDANFLQGNIGIMSFEPLSQEALDIQVRFAKVFEFTYTRFLDLQKAEAQAREAQIEAALERVRSKAMAMHSSEDLATTVDTFFSELHALNVLPRRCGVGIVDAETRLVDIHATTATEDNEIKKMTGNLTLKGHPVLEGIYDHWKALKEYHPVLRGKEISAYYKAMNPEVVFPDFADDVVQYGYYFNFKEGGVFAWTDKEFVESELQIFRRYTSVLSLTYRRYMDLKEAEAQAREARIEAALERVRAAGMAMHHTEELQTVIEVVCQQLSQLEIRMNTCTIGIKEENKKDHNYWGSTVTDQKIYTQKAHIPFIDHPIHTKVLEASKKGNVLFVDDYSMEETKEYMEHCFKQSYLDSMSKKQKQYILSLKGFARSVTFSKYSFISLINFHREKYSNEENEILKRFSKVFDQTYTRFLDLQKAEAQTREAQIELALERVRARAMAMQSSDELANLIITVFQELQKLDMVLTRCLLWIFNTEDNSATTWMTNSEHPNQADSYHIPDHKHPAYKSYLKGWKNRQVKWEYDLKGKDKERWDEKLLNGYFKKLPARIKKAMKDPDRVILSGSFNKYGVIQTAGLERLSDQNQDILQRFSQVFEQTFTRFLDLQKAEAQAREAKIEAALEKIRSRSLAMHQTDEMQLVANEVGEQLRALGIELDAVGMSGVINLEEGYDVWIGGAAASKPLRIPFNADTQVQREYNQIIKTRPELFTKTYSGKIKKEYIDKLLSQGEFPKKLRQKMIGSSSFSTSLAFARHSGIQIARYTSEPYTEDENEILKRFSKVFEQAYIRFMDLEKAEAQAREAKIESALERIRAASMAMHKSKDLHKVINLVYSQLADLGLTLTSTQIFDNLNDKHAVHFWLSNNVQEYSEQLHVPITRNVFLTRLLSAIKNDESFFTQILSKRQKDDLSKLLFDNAKKGDAPKSRQDLIYSLPGLAISAAIGKAAMLVVMRMDAIPYLPSENEIIKRFGKVFDQSYTRFLDLQKAEAQTREAQIEAALERIRARSMAMHSSEELTDVLTVLFQQFDVLGIDPAFAHLTLFDGGDECFTLRLTDTSGKRVMAQQKISLKHFPEWIKAYEAWKTSDENAVSIIEYTPEMLPIVLDLIKDLIHSMPEKSRIKVEDFPEGMWTVQGHCRFGYLGMNIDRPAIDEDLDIVGRFAREFGRLFQRFLDLQKAEAQAREALVEVSLERVRASTMAMHASDDVATATIVMFDELKKLGLHFERCGIAIPLDDQNIEFWAATSEKDGQTVRVVGQESLSLHPALQSAYTAWEKKQDYQNFVLDGKDLIAYYRSVKDTMPLPDWKKQMQTARKGREDFSTFPFTDGWVYIFRKTALEASSIKLLKRFAQVFDLTYRRYLDLQKAEAQVREAEIETALERLRAASMAMHRSEELSSTSLVMFQEIVKLGIQPWNFAFFIFRGESDIADCFASDQTGSLPTMVLPHKPDKFLRKTYEDWRANKTLTVQEAKGSALKKHQEYMKSIPGFDQILKQRKTAGVKTLEKMIFNNAHFKYGYLMINTLEPQTDFWDILQRLAKVFEQTYTRFLDLKKSEKQARDAQIEAALERVRSTSMAMHKSEELHEVVNVLHREFKSLDVKFHVVNLYLNIHKSKDLSFWTGSGDLLFPSIIHWLYVNLKMQDDIHKSWGSNKILKVSYEPKEKQRFLNELFKIIEIPNSLQARLRAKKGLVFIGSFRSLTGLQLIKYSYDHFTEEEQNIVLRFSKVFEQTYTRFLDLQKAEEQAREAQIEAALERIRARAMAMHKTDELSQVAVVLFQQLKQLNIQLQWCWFAIVNEEEEYTDIWYTEYEGDFNPHPSRQPFISPEAEGFVKAWKNKDAFYKSELCGPPLKEYVDILGSDLHFKGGASHKIFLENLDGCLQQIHAFFKYGSIGYSSFHPREVDAEIVLSRMASTFEIAYTRFLDLKKAEEQAAIAEKQNRELARSYKELKETQAQLIQSEKMASLGELTAGIAHEIQNPLNFVNNFSEVSAELLDEVLEELASTPLSEQRLDEAKEILNDLKNNLEKIHHHGGRASGIVKGMLDHSRTSSNEKSPTDINALCDEYLRLTYHGLRAKDKNFNAAFEIDLDKDLPLIEVVPQDIGRVLLNILNNAFYAVNQKRKTTENGYQPHVNLTTQQLNNPPDRQAGSTIQISISDNGSGIPKEIVDKIFQPFFTTKPTGSGTGLGLSLSYDIVKAHGGEMKVESEEGEGTTFTITIPMDL